MTTTMHKDSRTSIAKRVIIESIKSVLLLTTTSDVVKDLFRVCVSFQKCVNDCLYIQFASAPVAYAKST